MKFRGVIFDLDGTLLDTLDDLADSMNEALRRLDAPAIPAARYRLLVGGGLAALARAVLPEDRRDEETAGRCLAAMREIYAGGWASRTKPYDGIVDLLAYLKRENVRRAVLSNKAHDAVAAMVTHFFGAGAFDMVVGAGGFPLKPDPAAALHIANSLSMAPPETMFVGDSDVDMITATKAGMSPGRRRMGVPAGARAPCERGEAPRPQARRDPRRVQRAGAGKGELRR